jgi:hypothetical protein
MTSEPFQLPPAQTLRPCDPRGLGHGRVTPLALNFGIEADVAGWAERNPAPEGQFVGAVRASRTRLRDAEKGRKQPEGEQDCSEHEETLNQVRGVLGIDPDKCDRHNHQQQPSAEPNNAQLQSEMVLYAHNPMVFAMRLLRLLSRGGDMSIKAWLLSAPTVRI